MFTRIPGHQPDRRLNPMRPRPALVVHPAESVDRQGQEGRSPSVCCSAQPVRLAQVVLGGRRQPVAGDGIQAAALDQGDRRRVANVDQAHRRSVAGHGVWRLARTAFRGFSAHRQQELAAVHQAKQAQISGHVRRLRQQPQVRRIGEAKGEHWIALFPGSGVRQLAFQVERALANRPSRPSELHRVQLPRSRRTEAPGFQPVAGDEVRGAGAVGALLQLLAEKSVERPGVGRRAGGEGHPGRVGEEAGRLEPGPFDQGGAGISDVHDRHGGFLAIAAGQVRAAVAPDDGRVPAVQHIPPVLHHQQDVPGGRHGQTPR